MDEIVEQYSPKKSYKLSFYDFEEPRMGMSICRFSLYKINTNELIEFRPLWAIGIGQSGFSWSENEELFSIALLNIKDENKITCSFFIYNIKENQFASVYFQNCYILNGHCHNSYIEIVYREDQIPKSIAHNKYPAKDFSKPTNLRFQFSVLNWLSIKFLPEFNEINKNAIVQEFKLTDNGWRRFDGKFPENTEIIVWELERFAEYGDTQSKKWFDEIIENTKDINYWLKASYYIGFKIREYPAA
jgi:hypothetical protein